MGPSIRSYTEEDVGLLAAKYHISPKVAEAIIVDVRMSDNIVLQMMTSRAPKSETMTQIIERVSTTYQVKPDVVASLIVDELLLERTGHPHRLLGSRVSATTVVEQVGIAW